MNNQKPWKSTQPPINSDQDPWFYEYNELMEKPSNPIEQPPQWKEEGDEFREFSLFKDYMGPLSSNHTIPLKQRLDA